MFDDRWQIPAALQQRVKELTSLNLIAQTMATLTDLSAALNAVAGTVTRLFEADCTSISLLNETLTELEVVAHAAANPDIPSSVGLIFSPCSAEPFMHRVLQQRRYLMLLPAQAQPLIKQFLGPGQLLDIQCLLLVPLLVRGEVTGLISISTDTMDRRFTPAEIRLAETIAGQVASSIETARLFEQERRQRRIAESLREVATSLNRTLDRETVLETIFAQLGRVIHHDGGAVFLLDQDDLVISHAAGTAKCYTGHRLPLSCADVVVQTFKEKRPLILANTSFDPNWIPWERPTPILSWMGAPLLIGQEAIGVLSVDNFAANAYTPADAEVLLAFADQAAMAIHNARLYEQTQQDATIKTELLQEVNHRVKNNLMAIRGLLVMERRCAPEAGREFIAAAMESLDQRIQGLVKVHEILARSQWAPVLLHDLARQIITEALRALISERRIRVQVAESPVTVSPRQASSLALVINELATNTAKYAQPAANVMVSIGVEENMITLEYRDDGPGYPDEVLTWADAGGSDDTAQGTGLYLLRRITAGTLHGEVTIANQGGAVVRLVFKAEG